MPTQAMVYEWEIEQTKDITYGLLQFAIQNYKIERATVTELTMVVNHTWLNQTALQALYLGSALCFHIRNGLVYPYLKLEETYCTELYFFPIITSMIWSIRDANFTYQCSIETKVSTSLSKPQSWFLDFLNYKLI
jgi:hypothetical protein